MKRYRADFVWKDGALVADARLCVAAGRVVADGAGEEVAFPGCALLPGTVNAHSHCWQVLLRGVADHPRDFRAWVERHLYPTVQRLDLGAVRAAARLCFLEMLRAGVTSVGEFHYVHNGPGGADAGLEYDRAVIDAAREVGLRVAFLRTFYDKGTRAGQKRFLETPDQAVARTRALAEAYADDPAVTTLTAPHSLHGASAEMIRAGAALAEELGTGFHIHLAEQRGDLPYSRELYGVSPLRALERLGVLSARTTLVHGIWLDEGERARLAEVGGGLVSNPSTNMILGDGIAPLEDYLAKGVPVALGTDANYNASIFEEMRLAESLQRVSQRRMGILSSAGSADGEPEVARVFALGTAAGARNLHLPAGTLAPGEHADFLVIDLSDPSLFPASRVGGPALLAQLCSAQVVQRALRAVYVGGEAVLEGGRPLRVDPAEVVAKACEAWSF